MIFEMVEHSNWRIIQKPAAPVLTTRKYKSDIYFNRNKEISGEIYQ